MKTVLRSALFLASLLPLAGCGALFNGTRQTIAANASPETTTIMVDPGGQRYTTPTSISLERKSEYTLTFTKDGYSPGVYHIEKHLKAGIVVLDVLAGLVGVIVDAATGAWYGLDPSTMTVVLTKTTAAVLGPDTIRVGISRHGDRLQLQVSQPGVTVDVGKD